MASYCTPQFDLEYSNFGAEFGHTVYFVSQNETLSILFDFSRVFCMQKGFNSDITVRGKVFHIQTEDWGKANPYIVTRVFSGGAVLKTIKVHYDEALRGGPVGDSAAINLALRRQHHRILDELVSGKIS